VGRGREFVIEGDEYDSAFFDKTAKFLKYLPDIAVVNNIEFDHADIYASIDEIRLAFKRLAILVPRRGLLLLGGDSPDAAALASGAFSRVETFGLGGDHVWQARDIHIGDGATTFTVRRRGAMFGTFGMSLIGEHNVRNALAAIAVGADCGLTAGQLAEGLRTFRGVKRRLELVGEARGVSVVDDFAHHPTAIHETLRGVRRAHPGRRVWAVFEPRSASSCRRVFQAAFADAFGGADEVVIAPVYRSSLPEADRLSPEQLVNDLRAKGARARVAPSIDAIVETISQEARAGDLVVIMSNGGFGGIHRRLLAALDHG
jgi:UDP-N-acetylmuramate: L-alanyl-gamma-D-glutamyl-meso-diaminopimelate ligase